MQTPRYSRVATFLALNCLLLRFIRLIAVRNVYVCVRKCEIWKAYGYICTLNMKSFLYIGFTFTYENMRMMLRLYIYVSTRDTVGYET